MKTLVIFRLPDNKYVSCDLSRLAAFPQPGHVYLLNKQLYEVVQAIEPLGGGDGNMQLMELIGLEHSDQLEAATALSTMVNLDATPGKIDLATAPDKVIMVRTKAAAKGASKQRQPKFSLDVSQLTRSDDGRTGAPKFLIQHLMGQSAPESGTRRRRSRRTTTS